MIHALTHQFQKPGFARKLGGSCLILGGVAAAAFGALALQALLRSHGALFPKLKTLSWEHALGATAAGTISLVAGAILVHSGRKRAAPEQTPAERPSAKPKPDSTKPEPTERLTEPAPAEQPAKPKPAEQPAKPKPAGRPPAKPKSGSTERAPAKPKSGLTERAPAKPKPNSTKSKPRQPAPVLPASSSASTSAALGPKAERLTEASGEFRLFERDIDGEVWYAAVPRGREKAGLTVEDSPYGRSICVTNARDGLTRLPQYQDHTVIPLLIHLQKHEICICELPILDQGNKKPDYIEYMVQMEKQFKYKLEQSKTIKAVIFQYEPGKYFLDILDHSRIPRTQ